MKNSRHNFWAALFIIFFLSINSQIISAKEDNINFYLGTMPRHYQKSLLTIGDENIKVIPAISSPSCKNGERITFRVLIRSQYLISNVEAEIPGIETISLCKSEVYSMQTPDCGLISKYEAEWTGHHLEEKVYNVKICVTDIMGNIVEDKSLKFSDPAAGNSNIGSTYYASEITTFNSTYFSKCHLEDPENALSSASVDPIGGYAYFGTNTAPGRIVKIRLSDFTKVNTITLNYGEDYLATSVIDPAEGYVYFGTFTVPGKIVRISLSDFARISGSVITLGSGENYCTSSVIDPNSGYMYVGTWSTPGRVIKIRLSDFVKTDSLTLVAGDDVLRSAVIDTVSGYAYFGTDTSPGKVIKIRLSDMVREGAITLNTGEEKLLSAVIDTNAGYAYFGTDTNPGKVVKIQLSNFSRNSVLSFYTGENLLHGAFLDNVGKFAYFLTYTSPGRVVRIRLSDFSRAGAVALDPGEETLSSAALDSIAGYAYLGTFTYPGKVIRINLNKPFIKGTKITLPENGTINDIRLYSHYADGSARLAIYDNSEPKNLLWESGAVSNSKLEDWIIIPISSGSPAALTLNSGTYWFAHNLNGRANIASYTSGGSGYGFTMNYGFTSYPGQIAASQITSTAAQWSEYITYTPLITPVPTPLPDTPSQPHAKPILHAKLNSLSTIHGGGTVVYRYVWTSSGTDSSVTHGPTTLTEDILYEGESGTTIDVGELWRVTVTPINQWSGHEGLSFSGKFIIEADQIKFTGWSMF